MNPQKAKSFFYHQTYLIGATLDEDKNELSKEERLNNIHIILQDLGINDKFIIGADGLYDIKEGPLPEITINILVKLIIIYIKLLIDLRDKDANMFIGSLNESLKSNDIPLRITMIQPSNSDSAPFDYEIVEAKILEDVYRI